MSVQFGSSLVIAGSIILGACIIANRHTLVYLGMILLFGGIIDAFYEKFKAKK